MTNTIATGVRGGRIAPLKQDVLKMIKAKNGATVKAMAEKLGVPERDVRLAIDSLRAKGFKEQIVRSALGTFAFKADEKKGA